MDLGLEKVVKEEFEFLICEHGFRCIKSGPWLVKYQSELVFVTIRFDGKRSYELGCEIGRNDDLRGTLDVPFSLGEVVRSKGYLEKDVRTFFQITTENALKEMVKELSKNVRTYAHDLLNGTVEVFNYVADFREMECKDYALKRDLLFMRSQLDISWKNRDYEKVITLLTPFKNELEYSEQKKLAYALKHQEK